MWKYKVIILCLCPPLALHFWRAAEALIPVSLVRYAETESNLQTGLFLDISCPLLAFSHALYGEHWLTCVSAPLSIKEKKVENSADVPSSLTFTESDGGRALSQHKHSILITHKALDRLLKKKESEHFVVTISFKRTIKIDSRSWSSHKYPFRASGTKFTGKTLLRISSRDVICEMHL